MRPVGPYSYQSNSLSSKGCFKMIFFNTLEQSRSIFPTLASIIVKSWFQRTFYKTIEQSGLTTCRVCMLSCKRSYQGLQCSFSIAHENEYWFRRDPWHYSLKAWVDFVYCHELFHDSRCSAFRGMVWHGALQLTLEKPVCMTVSWAKRVFWRTKPVYWWV